MDYRHKPPHRGVNFGRRSGVNIQRRLTVKLTVPPQARRAAWVWRPSPTTMVGMTLPTNIKVELDRLFYDSN